MQPQTIRFTCYMIWWATLLKVHGKLQNLNPLVFLLTLTFFIYYYHKEKIFKLFFFIFTITYPQIFDVNWLHVLIYLCICLLITKTSRLQWLQQVSETFFITNIHNFYLSYSCSFSSDLCLEHVTLWLRMLTYQAPKQFALKILFQYWKLHP